MTKYTNLSNIINYLPKNLIEHYTEDTIIAKAYDAYTLLQVPQKFIEECKTVQIKNNTIIFNDKYETIKDIYYISEEDLEKADNETTSSINNCYSCKTMSLSDEELLEIRESCGAQELITKYHTIGCTINYRLFLDSHFKKSCTSKIFYSGRTNKNIQCEYCNGCAGTDTNIFSMDQSGTLRTNICDGYAIVKYYAYPKCDENFLIVDDVDVFNFIKTYIQISYLEEDLDRLNGNLRQMFVREKDTLATRIRGKYLIKNVSNKNFQAMKFDKLRFFANPYLFRKNQY